MADSLQLVIETLSAKENLKDLLAGVDNLTKGLSALKTAVPSKFFNDLQQTTTGLANFSTTLATVLTTAATINKIDTTKASVGFIDLATGVRTFTTEISKIADSERKINALASAMKLLSGQQLQQAGITMSSLASIMNQIDTTKASTSMGQMSTAVSKFVAEIAKIGDSSQKVASLNNAFSALSSAIAPLQALASIDFARFAAGINSLATGAASLRTFSTTLALLGKNASNLKVLTNIGPAISLFAKDLAKLSTTDLSKLNVLSTISKSLSEFASGMSRVQNVASLAPSIFSGLSSALQSYLATLGPVVANNQRLIDTIILLAKAMAILNPNLQRAASNVTNVGNTARNASVGLNLFSGGWSSVISAFIGGSILYKVVSIIKNTVRQFSALEQAMHRVNTISRVSNETLGGMLTEVKSISSEFGIAAPQVATALYDITSATITGSDALKVLHASAVQAVSGYTDIVSSANLISKVIKAYNMDASKASHITDVLFKTVERGINPMEELNKDFSRILAASNAAGISFQDVSAAVATLTSRGLKTNLAVTALNAAIMKLSAGNKKLDEVFIRLGYSSSAAAMRQMGLKFVMEELYKVTGGQMEQLKQLGFDYRDIRATTILTNEATRAFAENLRYISDPAQTAGAAVKALAEAQKSLTQHYNEFKESFTNANTAMLENSGTSEALKGILWVLTEALRSTSNEWVSMGVSMATAAGAAVAVASMGKALVAFFSSAKVAAALGVAGFGAVAASIAALTVAFSALAIMVFKVKQATEDYNAALDRTFAEDRLSHTHSQWIKQIRDLDKLTVGSEEYKDQLSQVEATYKKMQNIAPEAFSGDKLSAFQKSIDKTMESRRGSTDVTELEKVTKLQDQLDKLRRKEEAPSEGTYAKLLYIDKERALVQKKLADYAAMNKNKDLSKDTAALGYEIEIQTATNAMETLSAKLAESLRMLAKQLRDTFDSKGVTPVQKFDASLQNLNDTFEENKDLFTYKDLPSLMKEFKDMSKYGPKFAEAMIQSQIDALADPQKAEQLMKIFAELRKGMASIEFSKDSLLGLNESIKNLDYGRMTSLGKVKFLHEEINKKQKQFNELVKKGDALSLGKARDLAAELGDLRGKLYDVSAKNPSYRKATMLEGVSTGTKASIESITKAVASVYDKQIADNTKETSRYTKEQAAILKQLQKAGLKLVQ